MNDFFRKKGEDDVDNPTLADYKYCFAVNFKEVDTTNQQYKVEIMMLN